MYKSILLVLLISLTISCNNPTNYKNAYLETLNDKTVLKIKGKRRYMVHDFISIFRNDMYEDSCLIQIPKLCNNCTISGKDIPTKEGFYKFSGQIKIEGNIANVELQVDNTDDKAVYPYDWNGKYSLEKITH